MPLTITTILLLCSQLITVSQAGTCFRHRSMDVCYDVSEIDTAERHCTGPYYSDDPPTELDGFVYSEDCREVNATPRRCNAECGPGQECQWYKGEQMCTCSEAVCDSAGEHPICASNNMTFKSECLMHAWGCMNDQSGLYKKFDGECRKDCRGVRCSSAHVCLLVKNTGEPMCYPKAHCQPLREPESVCATNGITYPNVCVMQSSRDRRGRSPDLAHKGACERECRAGLCHSTERCVYSKHQRPVCIRCDPRPRFHTLNAECGMDVPVCGDNGRLYGSYCALLRDQCKNQEFIDIIDYGSCPVLRYQQTRSEQRSKLNQRSKLSSH